VRLEGSESVSTNFWLLSPDVFPFLEEGFRRFLGEGLRWYPGEGFPQFPGEMAQGASDDGRAPGRVRAGPSPEPEFLLPSEINRILAAGQARVRVVPGGELFLGITHPEDRAGVVESLGALVGSGHYPGRLWGEGTGAGTG
jgi:hypothetical protein